jgi:hypothetical protein
MFSFWIGAVISGKPSLDQASSCRQSNLDPCSPHLGYLATL